MTGEPRNLAELKRWYRHEILAEMGAGGIHVHLTDAGGDPDWAQRFKDLMSFPLDETFDVPSGELKPMRTFPIRWHLRAMARGGAYGRERARFLYVLACQNFDVGAAARAVSLAGYDRSGEQWALAYAEAALLRLWRSVNDITRNEPGGKPRTFVQRRIGKSEAQAAAEGAA